MPYLGYIAAIASAMFNGSFAAIFKFDAVADAELHPVLFQQYVCAGVFLSSWLTIPFLYLNPEVALDSDAPTTFSFSPLGLIAGALLTIALTFSFVAVQLVGLATAQGVWGGTAIIVSYVWGVLAFGDEVQNWYLSVTALFFLLLGLFVGVVGIACSQRIGEYFKVKIQLLHAENEDSLLSEHIDVQIDEADAQEHSIRGAKSTLLGMICSIVVGLSGKIQTWDTPSCYVAELV
eukprot:gene1003-1527_t